MVHEREYDLLVVAQMVLDEFVELCLPRLTLLLFLAFLNNNRTTSWTISFCSFTLFLVLYNEVSLRFTLSTFLTVFSSLLRM